MGIPKGWRHVGGEQLTGELADYSFMRWEGPVNGRLAAVIVAVETKNWHDQVVSAIGPAIEKLKAGPQPAVRPYKSRPISSNWIG